MIKKHTKPSAANPNGGIVEKEGSIHISNLALIDPKTGKPTRVGRKVVEIDGEKKIIRIAKKSGEEIK
jgi:large subunit ribosomal protein L24